MIDKPTTWPEASGVFNAPRTLVMTTASTLESRRGADTLLVGTPLDLIRHLEDPTNGLVTVVLTGQFAGDDDLHKFLRESYPRIELVVERSVVGLFDLSESMVA
jgi:hypothetical protein